MNSKHVGTFMVVAALVMAPLHAGAQADRYAPTVLQIAPTPRARVQWRHHQRRDNHEGPDVLAVHRPLPLAMRKSRLMREKPMLSRMIDPTAVLSKTRRALAT